MNKKASLFLALSLTLLIAGNYLFFIDEKVIRERVEILRVIDGDTVELKDFRKIRLLNINTPERGLFYSEFAKNYLSDYMAVELEDLGKDKYGRTLGRLYFEEIYLNLEIIKRGYAHSYLVYDSEKNIFIEAEKYARENELGIWERSPYYGCLKVEINKYEEYLDIEDLCGLNLIGWSIKDESTKMYKFEKDIDTSFRLYSNKGLEDKKNLYWGRENIWNDDHDRIFIRDSDGLLAYYSYY